MRAQGLEGRVARRRDSRYEPGERSGAWRKMRIGGYKIGGATLDALVFRYVSRTRNGFSPRMREELLKKFRGTSDLTGLKLELVRAGWSQTRSQRE